MIEEPLVLAAEKAITNKASNKALKYIKQELKEEFSNLTKRELDFYIEFIITGRAYSSYQKAFDPEMNRNTASTLANRLLHKVKINFVDFLEYAGHGPDRISEALDTLFDKDKDQYLKHITKLKQLDVQKVEHSGQIMLPTINIVSTTK
jgi:hypothetical protein